MKKIFFIPLALVLFFFTHAVFVNSVSAKEAKLKVLADLEALKALSIAPLIYDEKLGVGIVDLTASQRQQVLDYNHDRHRCGGFEVLQTENSLEDSSMAVLAALRKRVEKDLVRSAVGYPRIKKSSKIESALSELKSAQLRSWVGWLSSFPDRDNRSHDPNAHVTQLKQRLESLISGVSYAEVSIINHRQTRQKSLKVKLKGAARPQETVVLGGHLDSINMSWSGETEAPGADDNASGSANLIETLRVLLQQGQPARTVEFFWYAAEESGLIGSSEIAQHYQSTSKDVVAVLQLDMTLFAGSGELTIANITDYTSPWLRDLLVQINSHYIGARLVEDRCGYGCSDHASWYRHGYPTLLPFESATRKMNRLIHTTEDTINRHSNFNHSLAFSKIALAFAMELGNSTLRQP